MILTTLALHVVAGARYRHRDTIKHDVSYWFTHVLGGAVSDSLALLICACHAIQMDILITISDIHTTEYIVYLEYITEKCIWHS